jgi:tetratricopeptide (TPR) repeat protein
MDSNLTQEGTRMLSESKANLNSKVQPLLGRARSLREGQDLKGAYENYKEILKYEPTNEEALNEMDQIQDRLENRARKIYREAIISESLYLFDDAKEKFQEVQQISPTDSSYYKKATDKLVDYLD